MRQILLIFIAITISQTSFGKCPEDIQVLNKGQVANCDGLLFSKKASEDVDETQDDLVYYKTLSQKLEERKNLTDKELSVLDKRLQIYMEQSQILAEQVYNKERESKWQKFIYFGLGVFATGIAVYGASHLNR